MPEPGLSIVLNGATIGLIITNIGLIAKAIIDRNNSKKNKKPCGEHNSRLTVLETNQDNTIKAIDNFGKENREDHKEIFKILRNEGKS